MHTEAKERALLQCTMAFFVTREQLILEMEQQPSSRRDERVALLRCRLAELCTFAERLQQVV